MSTLKPLIISLILSAGITTNSTLAESFNGNGESIAGIDSGINGQYGNTIYAEDAYNYPIHGNTVIRDNGITYTTYGNTTYDNRGNTWTHYDNSVYGSDGSSCHRYGSNVEC